MNNPGIPAPGTVVHYHGDDPDELFGVVQQPGTRAGWLEPRDGRDEHDVWHFTTLKPQPDWVPVLWTDERCIPAEYARWEPIDRLVVAP